MAHKNLIFIIILFLVSSSFCLSQKLAIYSDDGTWLEGIIALESFCEENDFLSKRVYAEALNKGESLSDCSAICFPGGYAYNYKTALTMNGLKYIRSFINNGGAYIGICAGAYFASSSVEWEGETYPYQLKLFDGVATGSIQSIAKWDDHAMTRIKLNPDNPVTSGLNETYTVLYYGGPYFTPNPGFEFNTIAVWSDHHELPAIINFEYGKGKVCLIGPHLEIEENSNRDNTDFASELDDIESDWEVLYQIFFWLMDTNSHLPSKQDNKKQSIEIFPNPTDNYFNINFSNGETYLTLIVELFNVFGEKVISEKLTTSRQIIDPKNIPSGLYLIKIKDDNSFTEYPAQFLIIHK